LAQAEVEGVQALGQRRDLRGEVPGLRLDGPQAEADLGQVARRRAADRFERGDDADEIRRHHDQQRQHRRATEQREPDHHTPLPVAGRSRRASLAIWPADRSSAPPRKLVSWSSAMVTVFWAMCVPTVQMSATARRIRRADRTISSSRTATTTTTTTA